MNAFTITNRSEKPTILAVGVSVEDRLMAGKRETNKLNTRRNIIKVASEIFDEKGYEKTSINEIANKANLGVGTVYNYFPSKDIIFVESIEKKFDMDSKYMVDINQFVNKEVTVIIIGYIEKFGKSIRIIPKWLLKELFRITIGNKKNEKLLMKLAKIDFKFIDKLEEIFIVLKKENRLDHDFNVKSMAEIIYSIYAFEFLMYLYQESISFDDMSENIKNKIYILFENNMKKEV
jgi:AcrR family transcriptional regulator